jgi:hypothetical protein
MKVGIVERKNEYNLKKTIFRISRNNCFIIFFQFSDIFPSILEKEEENKLVFYLLFSGNKDGILHEKICKIINLYCLKDYKVINTYKNIEEELKVW